MLLVAQGGNYYSLMDAILSCSEGFSGDICFMLCHLLEL